MPEEEQGLIHAQGADILFTGLGKVNATYQLASRLAARKAQGLKTDYVINFGTAGSPKFSTHELLECTQFVQRDMDVSALGFKPGVTPFETQPFEIEFPQRIADLKKARCGSGDSFETGKPKVDCDVIDMEAFALAKVCRFEGLQFICCKYITDGADHSAANDWQLNLKFAGRKFSEVYQQLKKRLETQSA